jgi:hypothetical protein
VISQDGGQGTFSFLVIPSKADFCPGILTLLINVLLFKIMTLIVEFFLFFFLEGRRNDLNVSQATAHEERALAALLCPRLTPGVEALTLPSLYKIHDTHSGGKTRSTGNIRGTVGVLKYKL